MTKCKVTLFTKDRTQTKIQPQLKIDNQELPFNATPELLGVTFDRELTFAAHLKSISKKCNSRINVMKALSGTDWDCQRKNSVSFISPVYGLASIAVALRGSRASPSQPWKSWNRSKTKQLESWRAAHKHEEQYLTAWSRSHSNSRPWKAESRNSNGDR